MLASGWGAVDNSAFRDDVMTEWGSLLEKWDGKEKSRPKQLIKLCRQVRDDFIVYICVYVCSAGFCPQWLAVIKSHWRFLKLTKFPTSTIFNFYVNNLSL